MTSWNYETCPLYLNIPPARRDVYLIRIDAFETRDCQKVKVVLDLATKGSRIKRRRARARRFPHLRQAFPLRENEDAPFGNDLYKRFYCLFAGASISSRRDSLATFPVIRTNPRGSSRSFWVSSWTTFLTHISASTGSRRFA